MRVYREKVTEKLKNSKRENTAYEKVYLPNPRSLFDHRYRPDEQMVKKNVKWLEEIHYNPGQAKFMRQGRLKTFQTLLSCRRLEKKSILQNLFYYSNIKSL